MSAAFWIVGAALALAVTPFAPPTVVIGDLGWVLAAVDALAAFGAAALLLRRPEARYSTLLLGGYVGIVQIAVAQWLAGGLDAPYWQLYILPVLQITAVHPPRRILALFATLVVAAAAPLVYDGWRAGAAGAILLGILLWIGTGVITYRLMRELRRRRVESLREEDHARQLARLDALTGLNNRRAFDEAIGDQISHARTTSQPLSVLLSDVDAFKQINDVYGHVNGDSCLRQVARTIQVSVRATDACFRWGGDEFAVLLPDTDAEHAAELSERIQTAVRSSCRDPAGMPLGVSCGHTQLADGMGTRELLQAADLALLALKRSLTR
jgi:diguanylate cyclase (GGDEF)-like protein